MWYSRDTGSAELELAHRVSLTLGARAVHPSAESHAVTTRTENAECPAGGGLSSAPPAPAGGATEPACCREPCSSEGLEGPSPRPKFGCHGSFLPLTFLSPAVAQQAPAKENASCCFYGLVLSAVKGACKHLEGRETNSF